MSRTRRRMAAAQAALSVVLLLVVYLTLLRPESRDELPRAVNAEQGTELEVDGSFPASRGRDDAAGGPPGTDAGLSDGDAPLGGSEAAESPVAPGAPDAGYEGGSPAPGGQGFGPTTADVDEDPTDDQYADEVSGLLGRVRAAN